MKRTSLIKIALCALLIFSTSISLTFILSQKTKANEGTVTATVTIGIVSVSVDPSSFDYGTIPFNSSKSSFDAMEEANIKATVGTVKTDLDIKGADTTDWTLEATPEVDQYAHKFGTAADSTTQAGSYAALTTTYSNTLATELDPEDDIWFGLEIETPTSGTATQQNAVVTILASWAGE